MSSIEYEPRLHLCMYVCVLQIYLRIVKFSHIHIGIYTFICIYVCLNPRDSVSWLAHAKHRRLRLLLHLPLALVVLVWHTARCIISSRSLAIPRFTLSFCHINLTYVASLILTPFAILLSFSRAFLRSSPFIGGLCCLCLFYSLSLMPSLCMYVCMCIIFTPLCFLILCTE